jgi:hypothetical protein
MAGDSIPDLEGKTVAVNTLGNVLDVDSGVHRAAGGGDPEAPIGNRRPDCRELLTSSELLAELMVEYGALEHEPALDELIRPGFCDG